MSRNETYVPSKRKRELDMHNQTNHTEGMYTSLPMSDSDMKLMTVDQFHMESAFKRARNMGVKYSHEFYSHDPLDRVSCDHYARRVL